jgi:hypothetical protein
MSEKNAGAAVMAPSAPLDGDAGGMRAGRECMGQ